MASDKASELIRGAGAPGAARDALAVEPPATAAHTSVCFWSTTACSRTLGWTMVFDAVNCELLPVQRPCSTQKTSRKRFGANRHDAVFADDAVLLAAADEFAGQQQQRTLAAVDEHELVHRRVILRRCSGPNHAAVTHHAGRAALADDHLATGQTFFQR